MVALEDHFHTMARKVRDGVLIPFLGAGVNSYRSGANPFRVGQHLPSGLQLARYLAETCRRIDTTDLDHLDLARIAQDISTTEGDGALYWELHKVFDTDVPPTPLHHLLATFPKIACAEETRAYPLIITTNYDDALERAFTLAGEEFDTFVYIAKGPSRGRLLHRDPDGNVEIIRNPGKYDKVTLSQRSVIVKIHGGVRRQAPDHMDDSYVITEDHYIEYLLQTDLKKLIPVELLSRIRLSHFLFLGYSLRDWNLRVILHRMWGEQELDHKSWSVRLDPDDVETKYWSTRNVDIVHQDLADYVAGLQHAIALDPTPAA